MVRLFAVKASIIALKRAISLSDKLKPATWEFLAICSAALFVISVWGFSGQQRSHSTGGGSSLAPQIDGLEWSTTRPGTQPFAASIMGENFVNGSIVRWSSTRPVLGHVAIAIPSGDHLHLSIPYSWGGYQASTMKPLLIAESCPSFAMMSLKDVRSGWDFPVMPSPERFFRQAPTVIFQSSPEAGGFRKEVMFWAPLVGMLLSPIAAFGMMILAWIGLHRKRAEEGLLLLELEKRRLEIEKLTTEVDLIRQEANKPRIILG